MKRLSKKEVIEAIIKAAEDKEFDVCTLITLAHIETGGTFNNMAKNGIYLGTFQMQNGYGGVKGDDRLDPYKSAIGTINAISPFKKKVEDAGIAWQPFYIYLRHQQGEAGAFWLIEDGAKGRKIKEHYNRATKKNRGDVLINNSADAWKLTLESKVSEWLAHWGEHFNTILEKCDYKCTVNGFGDACTVIMDGEEYRAGDSTNVDKPLTRARNYYL